ncbi:MAG: hypothetical protein Q7U23_12315 [Methylococcales bacterium]|nr:hypothetical protein [Methylococcales bacterium]
MSEIEILLTMIGIVLVVFSIIGGGLKQNDTKASSARSLVCGGFFCRRSFLLLEVLIESGFFKHL